MDMDLSLDLESRKKELQTIDSVTLAEKDLPPLRFAIRDLLPQGLAILGGSPKVGKSWLTLDWCVRIAKGENIWDPPTTKGTTLYISLEDSETRLQDRLLAVTENATANLHFATMCLTIGNGLEEQMLRYISE